MHSKRRFLSTPNLDFPKRGRGCGPLGIVAGTRRAGDRTQGLFLAEGRVRKESADSRAVEKKP